MCIVDVKHGHFRQTIRIMFFILRMYDFSTMLKCHMMDIYAKHKVRWLSFPHILTPVLRDESPVFHMGFNGRLKKNKNVIIVKNHI